MKKLQSISNFKSKALAADSKLSISGGKLPGGGASTLQPQENITCVSSQGSDTQTVTYDDDRTVVSTGPIIIWN
ncbi:MAG: hypothetical protein MUW56_05740 [Chryseobacterium sp.]|uniref:hypothetical protein n=1 Tax=Chryseobacterium sp. TaxID=1871047 RepID=UPI0025B96B8A|nr:hypothetical protein [Chryseobacterium sp.]MCJ7933136.1 hypothetical protein [Chryseobacterium sp.]